MARAGCSFDGFHPPVRQSLGEPYVGCSVPERAGAAGMGPGLHFLPQSWQALPHLRRSWKTAEAGLLR